MLGIIGGSGVYNIEGLENTRWVKAMSSFGEPSDEILIGELAGQAFRIAHMGHVNAPMVLGTLGVIEVGLSALKIPHGRGGTEAAIDWLGESVSA